MKVLDKGYVAVVDCMGSDLTVVNSARVSFDKSVHSLGRTDLSLIDYLIRNKHDSVLRHCVMSFEVYAPLMVARQWYKHAVSSTFWDEQNGWNESSRRYVTEEPEFYIPEDWRGAAADKKQGSANPIPKDLTHAYNSVLDAFVETGLEAYNRALEDGVCVEQARMFLPAYAMYVRWRWTASLNALLHFINLRKDSHAQWEIQQYAGAIEAEVRDHFPNTYASWSKYRG